MEFASKVAGSRLIVVLGHSSCGAIKGACDNVQLGYVSALVKELQPAVEAIPDDGRERTSKNAAFVEKVAHANVEITVKEIVDRSDILRDMAAKGQIKVVGAMLDVERGKVTFIE
jgi:carbonic anhydrase